MNVGIITVYLHLKKKERFWETIFFHFYLKIEDDVKIYYRILKHHFVAIFKIWGGVHFSKLSGEFVLFLHSVCL